MHKYRLRYWVNTSVARFCIFILYNKSYLAWVYELHMYEDVTNYESKAIQSLEGYTNVISILWKELTFFVDACMFHPGEPVFHDAYKVAIMLIYDFAFSYNIISSIYYRSVDESFTLIMLSILKIWSCCKQRSTDFTVFLNHPVGQHC